MLEHAKMVVEEYEATHDNVEIIDIREDCEEIAFYIAALKYVERFG